MLRSVLLPSNSWAVMSRWLPTTSTSALYAWRNSVQERYSKTFARDAPPRFLLTTATEDCESFMNTSPRPSSAQKPLERAPEQHGCTMDLTRKQHVIAKLIQGRNEIDDALELGNSAARYDPVILSEPLRDTLISIILRIDAVLQQLRDIQ